MENVEDMRGRGGEGKLWVMATVVIWRAFPRSKQNYPMKPRSFLFAGVALLLAAGCSTTDSRISKNSDLVASWPADVQAKVRAGQVAVGFTPDQVRVALGEPDRTLARTEAQGSREVWVYLEKASKFSFGVGVGGGGGGTSVGGGVGVNTGGRGERELRRVIFESGRVSAIEEIKR